MLLGLRDRRSAYYCVMLFGLFFEIQSFMGIQEVLFYMVAFLLFG